MREKRRHKVKNKIIALMMALLTIISTLSPSVTKTVKADTINSYPVTINFFELDGKAMTQNPQVYPKGYGYTLFVLATLTDKETGKAVGYGYVKMPSLTKQSDTFNITKFYTTEEIDYNWTTVPLKKEMSYDPDKYDVSLRLYNGMDPDSAYGNQGLGYTSLLKQDDFIDGYIFKDTTAGADSGNINLYKGSQEYNVKLVFDSENVVIDKSSNYYILVTATHSSGDKSYYYSKLSTDGKKEYIIPIKNGSSNFYGDWQDNNGNKTKEKYSGSWGPIDITILKGRDGWDPNLNSALNGTNVSVVNEIKGYRINHVGITSETDYSRNTVVDYDVVKFSTVEVSDDYNYKSILGDAINYGIVSKTITQNEHSETNFATTSYSNPKNSNFDSDLSGNGSVQAPGNYLVGEIAGSNKMRIGSNTPDTTLVMVGKGSEGKVQDETGKNYAVVIPMDKSEINSAVENMIDHMKKVSADMAKKEATITPEVTAGNLYIDTTGFPDGTTIYIDADQYDYYKNQGDMGPLRKDEGLNISMLPNQTIVFNFKSTEEVYIGKAHVNFNDGVGVIDTDTKTGKFQLEQNVHADKIARQLVWNCPVAKKVETHIAGGIYLAPNDNAEMILGDTTCGWGISAGNTIMGIHGEFHYVYNGLSNSNSITLHAYKTVDGENAASDQTFKFGIQRYDEDKKAFVDVLVDGKDSSGNPAKVPYIVENKNEIISIPVQYMEDGLNTFRIYEIGKTDSTQGAYKANNQEFFAQFLVNVIDVKGTQYKVPGGVTYYAKADSNGKVSDKISSDKVVFENESAGNCFVISKEVTGDEDPTNPYFDLTIIGKSSNTDDAKPLTGEYDVDGIENTDKVTFNVLGMANVKIRKDDSITIMGLPKDVYLTVMEAKTDGYTLKNTKENLSGIVTDDVNNPTKVELVNEYERRTEVTLSKKAVNGTEELPGAELKITSDAAGENVVKDTKTDEDLIWTSTSTAKTVSLKDGTYYMTETTAPKGYKVSEVVSFKVEDGKVTKVGSAGDVTGTTVTMLDAENETEVTLSKKAVNGTDELPGAELKITSDAAGENVVKDAKTDENLIWTSTSTAKTVSLKDGTYYMTETTAPKGYKVSEVVSFKVEDGKVTKVGNAGDVNGTTVTMLDAENETEVTLSKKAVNGTDELPGAELKITSDAAGENVVKDAKTDEDLIWTSTSTAKTVSLKDGTYYMTETTAPKGYKVSEVVSFKVEDGKVTKVGSAGDVTGTTVTMLDAENETEVTLSKKAVNGTDELPGAELKITSDAEGKDVVKDAKTDEDLIWTSTATAKTVSLKDGTYYMTETTAPKGYEVSEVVSFKVEDGKVTKVGNAGDVNGTTVTMRDAEKTVGVKISKVDAGTGKEISGAEMKLTDSTGKEVDKWTSTDKVHEITVVPGTYTIHEETAPKGYEVVKTDITFTVDADGKVTLDEAVTTGVSEIKDGVIIVKDEPTKPVTHKVKVSKVDATDSKEIAGAKIVLKDSTGKTVDEWESTTSAHEVELAAGTYTIHEEAAPKGYEVVKTDIIFTVDTDGKVTLDETVTTGVSEIKDGVIVVKDEPTKPVTHKVKVSKVDATDSKEIAGAKIVLKDSTGKTVDEWESTTSAHEVELAAGTYTIHEEAAPKGYEVVKTDIIFTVDADGKVTLDEAVTTGVSEIKDGVIVVKDEPTKPVTHKVKVSKVDATDSKEIAGAKIVLKDSTGKTVDEWESTTSAHEVELAAGTYTIHEEAAPKGYEVVKTDIIFTVDADGKVTLDEAVTTGVSEVKDGVIVVKDEPTKPVTHKVKVSKVDATDSKEIAGAKIVLKDSTGKTVDEWESTTSAHEVELAAGTYTIHEEAAPKGYEVVKTDIIFTVDADGKVTLDEAVTTGVSEIKDGVIVVKDEPTKPVTHKVKVSKVDATDSKEIAGAKIVLKDSTGKTVDEWKSTTSAHEVELAAGTYTIHEEAAPKGYEVVKTDIIFTVDADGNVTLDEAVTTGVSEVKDGVIVVKDEPTKPVTHKVKVSKVDATDSKEIAGAKIVLKDSTGKTVDEWESTTSAHEVELAAGTYTIHEEAAPKGYEVVKTDIIFTVDADGKVTLDEAVTTGVSEVKDGVIVVKDEPEKNEDVTVKISKVDAGTGKEISGAEMKLTDSEGTEVESWTSTDKIHEITVAPGTYTIHEETAPDGYEVVKTDITFTVDENGNVTLDEAVTTGVSEVKDGVIVVKDEPKKNEDVTVKISKVDAGTGKEISGAEMKLTDSEGTEVESWTSTDKIHEITVAPGTYTIHEETAPDGYEVVKTDITFTVDADGKVTLDEAVTTGVSEVKDGVIVVKDEPEKNEDVTVKISKVDAGTGKEISGAEMKLTDSEGTEVESWTSTDKIHEITVAPGTYTIHEETAPKGYEVVKTDITFTVDADGKVTLDEAVTTGVSEVKDGVIVVKDEPEKNDDVTVKISKVILGGEELEGASIIIRDSKDEVVDEWTSTKDVHETVLKPGTYTLNEEAAPEGYDKVETTIEFEVDAEGKVTVTKADTTGLVKVNDEGVIVVANAPTQPDETTVKISKVDAGTGDEIPGAKMQLTDSDDNVVADWESTDKSHEVTLKPGTYTIHEEAAPKGYEVVKTDITFTVDENGNVTLDKAVTTGVSEVKDGVIVVKDEPEKNDDVTVKISKVALGGEELEGASIIIRDSKDEVVDEWTSTKDVHETVLKPGTYTLNEEAAPEGYDKVETTIEFEVDAEGKVTVTKADTTGLVKVNDEGVIVVANAPTQPDETTVKISKVDAGTGDEIPGAKMQLTDSDDNVVADWESTDKPHEVTLKPGTYTIHEEAAPKGYEVVKTDITFTVDADGKVTLDSAVTTGVSEVVDGVIVVKDEPLNTVKVSKVDAGTGEELEGAKIVLKDSEGNEVDTWISEKKPHEVELIPGTYTIIEDTAPEGYDTVHSEITFTVDSDGNVTLNDAVTTGVSEVNEDGVLLVKDEPLKGSIVITKSFDGNNVTEEEKEGGLQFQVTTTVDNKTVWLDSEGNLSETEVTLTLANDFTYDEAGNTWTKTFDNVPIGKYTVEETNTTIEGYNFKGSTFNGVEKANNKVEITVEADEESKVEIVDAYEQVASLTVKKAVTDEAAAAAADKTYRIALKNSAGKYFNGTEFTDSEKYFEISIAEPYTFENLPVDQTYTVVEDLGDDNAKVELTGFAFEGYEVADVELGKDDATVTITNKYTRDKGDLVITKLVKGPVTEEEFNGALTFTVVDAKGNEINVTKNDGTTGSSKNMTIKDYFELVSGENGEFTYKLTIKDVPTGKYTVTETNSTFDGYELVSEHGGGSVNVVKGEEAISNFVDEYQPSTGTLEIVKDFKNAPTNLEASKMVFEISGPAHFNNGENLIVTYADFTDGKYVIENAPIGRYTVTETAQEDAKVDGSDKYTFSKEASTLTGSREVLKGATATVTLKNVYEKNEILGSLTVNKTVSMNDGSPVPEETFVSDKVFNITVQNTDTGLYVAGDGEYSESPVEHQISGGQAVVFNNLKLGNYTVSEDVADATKVDYRVIYDGSESVPEATAALTADSKNANVSISNVYRHYEPEEIVDYPVFFSKEDSLSGAEVPGATIELYKGESATGTPYKTWVSSLTSHVENLEEGKYTFKETVAPEGYDIVTTEIKFEVMKDDSEKGYSVSLIDLSDEVLKAAKQRDDGTLVLKNDPMLGLLKVVKVVKTDTGNIPVVDGFHVTIQNLKNGLYVQNTDGVLGSAAKDILIPIGEDGKGSVDIRGLRPATYLVVEKDADAKNVAGFIYDANGSKSEVNGLIELGESEFTVTLENDYVEDVGTLEVTKTVTGDAPADKTEFKVTVKNADGKYLTADGKVSDEKAVLTVKAGEKLTFNNIPSGKYTVEEDVEDAENVVGYKYNSEASVVAKDATVTHDKTATVELINDYTETSTGFIEVHVTEEKSGKDVHDATVVVTNKKTGEEFTYKTDKEGKIVDEDGKTPEVPSGEYTVIIKDVPKGYDISTGEKGDVTVPKNETGKHEAVIKTERGGIVITVFDEETGNVVPNAEVTITTPDGNTKTFITDSEGQVKEYSKTDEYGNYTQEPGTFTYVVTKVPTGYKVTTGESQTGVVEAGKLTELEARISPKTGGLDIQVLDEKTLEPVVNAVVEIKTPDGAKVEITTDQNGMINKFVEKDKNGNYTAKVGEYDITVIKVPEGYSVTTGQTKTETVVEGEVKHHVAKIATAKNSTDTDTTNKNNTNKDTNKNNNTTVNNNKNSTKKTDTNAKTGDATEVAGIIALMLLSLAAVVEIIRRKKEDEE